jgi:hypothetical protein
MNMSAQMSCLMDRSGQPFRGLKVGSMGSADRTFRMKRPPKATARSASGTIILSRENIR